MLLQIDYLEIIAFLYNTTVVNRLALVLTFFINRNKQFHGNTID